MSGDPARIVGVKSRWPIVALLAAATAMPIVTFGIALALRPSGDRVAAHGGTVEGPYRGSEPPGRIPLASFRLRGYRGNLVTSAQLRGRVVLLTFLDSHCTDACPVIANVVSRTVEQLTPRERREVRAIAVTTDPVHDTPATIRTFLARQRATGTLEYLDGSERELRRVWDDFFVLSSLESGRAEIHSAPVRIYDRESVWVATLHVAADLDESNLLHDLRVALRR